MRGLNVVAAALVTLAFALPARSADMAVPVRPKAPPLWTWSGCYMGVNAGYGWGRDYISGATETSAGGAIFRFADFNFQNSGAFGGGQFGCNWQVSFAVFGIETDIQASDIKGDIQFPRAIFNFPNAFFNTEVTPSFGISGPYAVASALRLRRRPCSMPPADGPTPRSTRPCHFHS